MPHREKPFGPAPSSGVAGAHQGPRVFGFANPDHGLPPVPVQPGTFHLGSAQSEVEFDNKWAAQVGVTLAGPAQPGLQTGKATTKSGEARRSRYPFCAPAVGDRGTLARIHPNMPGRPGARNRPKPDRRNICPADSRSCQASGTHSTRHHLDQSLHLASGRCRIQHNSAFPTSKGVPAHSKALDCSPGPAQVPGPATGNRPGNAVHTGNRSIAAPERDDGNVPPGSLPPAGTP
eukprot:6461035-Amphidinium_carterae.2